MPGYQRVQVTPELLQAAWAMPRGPAWPATYAEAAQHPFFCRLLRARAIGIALERRRRQQAPFDARRAAANDLE